MKKTLLILSAAAFLLASPVFPQDDDPQPGDYADQPVEPPTYVQPDLPDGRTAIYPPGENPTYVEPMPDGGAAIESPDGTQYIHPDSPANDDSSE